MLATPTWHSPLPSAWGPCTTRHTAIWCSAHGCYRQCICRELGGVMASISVFQYFEGLFET